VARRKTVEAEPTDIVVTSPTGQKVVIWKATRPLTTHEHEQLSTKLRYEEEQTGLTIMLVPFTVDVDAE
jgi:hypothetical protein